MLLGRLSVVLIGWLLFAQIAFAQESGSNPIPDYILKVPSTNLLFQQSGKWEVETLNLSPTYLSLNLTGLPNGNIHFFDPARQSILDLARSSHVQKLLELTDDQKKRLQVVEKRLTDGYAKIEKKYPMLRDEKLPNELRKELNRKYDDEVAKLRKTLEAEVDATLIPHQIHLIKRLKFNQSVSSFGFSATLSREPYAKEIMTTEKQKKLLAKIKKDAEAEIQKKIAEIQRKAKEKMLKALDKKQRDIIKKLEGDSRKENVIRL